MGDAPTQRLTVEQIDARLLEGGLTRLEENVLLERRFEEEQRAAMGETTTTDGGW